MKNNLVTIIIVAVIVGAVGFFAGMQFSNYQQSQRRNSFSGFGQGGAQGGQFQGRAVNGTRSRPVDGIILNQDANSITVKMQDGSTKIVVLSATTNYVRTSSASKNDLKVGDTVGAFGTENSDGTMTATNIQLNPVFRNLTGGAPRQ
ncbi:DUF5666 domain-containing protein [Patescibacteria group bacterium]|nr:DUF5666 domain-containing protein [Patescibacteria group bacterium]